MIVTASLGAGDVFTITGPVWIAPEACVIGEAGN